MLHFVFHFTSNCVMLRRATPLGMCTCVCKHRTKEFADRCVFWFSGRRTIGLSTARRWRSSRSIGRPSSSGRSSCLHSCDRLGLAMQLACRPWLCMRGLCECAGSHVLLHSFLARPRFRARPRAPALRCLVPPWPRTLRPGGRAPNRVPTPAHPTRHCPGT